MFNYLLGAFRKFANQRHIVLRGIVVHTFYVDVVTTATMYLGTVTAAGLHGMVISTTSTWDSGSLVLILLVTSCYA